MADGDYGEVFGKQGNDALRAAPAYLASKIPNAVSVSTSAAELCKSGPPDHFLSPLSPLCPLDTMYTYISRLRGILRLSLSVCSELSEYARQFFDDQATSACTSRLVVGCDSPTYLSLLMTTHRSFSSTVGQVFRVLKRKACKLCYLVVLFGNALTKSKKSAAVGRSMLRGVTRQLEQ